MKYLDGREMADFIKERQAKEVRRLKGAKIEPRLAIVSEGTAAVNQLYLKIKQAYGRDIGVAVDIINTDSPVASKQAVLKLNEDRDVHGIIVQLPITKPSQTDSVVNLIEPAKDVDGLGEQASYDSATATAILWLLASYNVSLPGKRIALLGTGRLVGQPLADALNNSGLEPELLDIKTPDIQTKLSQVDVIIASTGQPGLLAGDMVKPGAVVVDAGAASEGGVIRGDAADELYERQDITITPKRGGVGPLTVAALFDNVLRAARATVGVK